MDETFSRRSLSSIGKLLPPKPPRTRYHGKAAGVTQTLEVHCQISTRIMSRTAEPNVFADLSGTSNSTTDNPYDALLEACKQEPVTANSSLRGAVELIVSETNPASLSDAP